MNAQPLPFLLPALLATGLAAQTTIVFPSDHDLGNARRVEGYSWQGSFPFSSGVSRQMALYEAHDLNIPHNAQITHLGFPRDGNTQSLGHAVRMQIFMGPANSGVAGADRTFANNYASSPVEVFSVKNFTLPDLGFVTPPPLVDVVVVPLDTPYVFDSTRNLIVEYRIYANSNANQAFTYRLDFARFLSPVTSHGQGCTTSAGNLPRLESTGTPIGSTWRVRLSNAPASATAALNIGLGLLPSPITIPGTNGACNVMLGALASVGLTTGTSGTGNWSFPVPNDIRLNDFDLFSQAFAVDFFANPAGIVVSNADQIELGMDPRMAVITARGDANAATGSLQRYWGAVSMFQYQ